MRLCDKPSCCCGYCLPALRTAQRLGPCSTGSPQEPLAFFQRLHTPPCPARQRASGPLHLVCLRQRPCAHCPRDTPGSACRNNAQGVSGTRKLALARLAHTATDPTEALLIELLHNVCSGPAKASLGPALLLGALCSASGIRSHARRRADWQLATHHCTQARTKQYCCMNA